MDMDLKRVIESIQSQEKTWRDVGFNEFMERPPDIQGFSSGGFLSQDVIDSVLEGISGAKILKGISKSANGVMEIDWEKGVIKINFPGNVGYMKMGITGTDLSGNQMLGIIVNDGDTDRWFGGYQKGGF